MATETDFDHTKDPHLVLWRHIATKAWQTGSVLGVTASVPWLLYKRRFNTASMASSAANWGVGGLVLLSAVAYVKVARIDKDGMEDRAYRIHYNEGQNRCDRFALIGTGAGAATITTVKVAMRMGGLVSGVVGGAAIGSALGVLAHVATMSGGSEPNKMLEEVKAD